MNPREDDGMDLDGNCTRRRFIRLVPAGAVLLAPLAPAKPKPAPPPDPSTYPHLDERDPHAKAVGYVEDATRVDRKAYPKFRAGSTCDNCALYRVAAQPWSECTLFPRKRVAAAGWCDAYVRRAAA
ncbi:MULTISPECIES: high-potential iron-sulfur protein [unclassified Rhizobacter]|uniref:high-potential iron-sulfur protein n=1 Tax=unclassified Rhizobacter TaxID=2640088 RepID=UPI001F34EE16|nr:MULTISPECIES: high-potential iron-sulfur protein [unclassified Rhizobacter]